MEITGIKYTAPLFDNSGYARASRGNVLALHHAGVPITLNPISFEQTRPDLGSNGTVLRELVSRDIPYNIHIIHTTPEFWDKYRDPTAVNVGKTIWETTKLHPEWVPHINNNVTKVLVGCEWNVEVFHNSGVNISIGVVPHGINIDEYNGVEPFQIGGVPEDEFTFYSIFQWSERKNPMALLRAYYYAFTGVDDVSLVLKTYRMSYDDKEVQALRNIIKSMRQLMKLDHYPKISFISNMLSEQEITALHTRGDCYVSLDRGEGFGLGPFQAGAAGNPIIVTGFGGTTEYAKDDNSYLVDYTLAPVHGMTWSPWYRGDQLWADPDILQAAAKMRWVYENRAKAKERGAKLKQYIADNFSWETTADRIITELKEI